MQSYPKASHLSPSEPRDPIPVIPFIAAFRVPLRSDSIFPVGGFQTVRNLVLGKTLHGLRFAGSGVIDFCVDVAASEEEAEAEQEEEVWEDGTELKSGRAERQSGRLLESWESRWRG